MHGEPLMARLCCRMHIMHECTIMLPASVVCKGKAETVLRRPCAGGNTTGQLAASRRSPFRLRVYLLAIESWSRRDEPGGDRLTANFRHSSASSAGRAPAKG